MSFFAPHIPPYILKHLIEREMRAFRRYLGLGSDEPIDPFEIAGWLGVEVRYPEALSGVASDTRRALLRDSGREWSGLTVHLPDGTIVAVLNSAHSIRRQRATLMEEVAHVHLGHASSAIAPDTATGMPTRTYDARCEQEAYRFGSAMLVPKDGLRACYERGNTLDEAASHFGVSHDLVLFRTRLCGLGKRVR